MGAYRDRARALDQSADGVKLRALRAEIARQGLACRLEIDGGITLETAPLAIEAGADILVAGSAVYGAPDTAERVRAFKAL